MKSSKLTDFIMNIFFLSWSTRLCARWAFDKHVTKMILEYCQLLCTCHWLLTDEKTIQEWQEQGLIYKMTHKNHPCAIWVRQHENNYTFLCKLAKAFCNEYYYRYGKYKNPPKRYKSEKIIDHLTKHIPKNFPKLPENTKFYGHYKVTLPAQAMFPQYKVDGDTIKAYRRYYQSEEKKHLRSWKHRKTPEWFDLSTVTPVDDAETIMTH